MINQLQAETTKPGLCLYSPAFDRLFIFGTLAIALTLGALASMSPAALLAVVLVDIWLFANPHVVATFTRIGAQKADVKNHWFLIFLLPAIVLVGLTAAALAYEVAGLFTFYLFAQTYHVVRQSFGIARHYKGMESGVFRPDRLSEAVIYIFPLWGLLNWCAQAPETFLGYPIHLPMVAPLVVNAVGLIAITLGAWWVIRQCRDATHGRMNLLHDWFVASHLCVFVVAYLWVADITLGWLMVNIWHNVQYLFFVWQKNAKRDAALQPTSPPEASSFVFPWRHAANYLALCVLAGAALYGLIDSAGQQFLWLGLPTVLIAHFTLNFHHYLVDGVIWKRRGSPQR